jgi:hypothetical protein
MKIFRSSFALIAVCGLAAAHAGDAKAEFAKWYKAGIPKLERAFETKDIRFFDSVASTGFTYKAFTGEVQKRTDALAGLKQMFAMMDTIDCKFTMGKVSVKGTKATVDATSKFRCTMQNPQTKKTHKLDTTTYERQSWVKQGGKWMISGIVEYKKPIVLLDGKPVDPRTLQPISGG